MEQSTTFNNELVNIYPLVLSEKKRRYLLAKRIVDMLIATAGLLVLLPLFLIVATCIKLESPKDKIFFLQERVGRGGKVFKIIKFRSMKSDTPNNLATRDINNPEKYISSIGKLIRKSSIDELPQLWNVLKGEMSIIGPRPLILAEQDIHALRQYYGIYQVLPGITGLAQVNGRDTIGSFEKVQLDWNYIENLGIYQDVKILLGTVKVVLKRDGYQEGKINKYTKEAANETHIHCWEQRNTGSVWRL